MRVSRVQVVGNYNGSTKQYEAVKGRQIHWGGGQTSPPPDTPECGFDGSKCPEDRKFLFQLLVYNLLKNDVQRYWEIKWHCLSCLNRRSASIDRVCRVFFAVWFSLRGWLRDRTRHAGAFSLGLLRTTCVLCRRPTRWRETHCRNICTIPFTPFPSL